MLPFSMIRRRSTPRHSLHPRFTAARTTIFLRVHAGNPANPFLSCGYFITCVYPGVGGLPFSATSVHGACPGLVGASKSGRSTLLTDPFGTRRRPLVYPELRRATIPCRIRTYEKCARSPFRMSTSKTKDLKLFRMNTYEKTGEG